MSLSPAALVTEFDGNQQNSKTSVAMFEKNNLAFPVNCQRLQNFS
jgi:hypothetical protein